MSLRLKYSILKKTGFVETAKRHRRSARNKNTIITVDNNLVNRRIFIYHHMFRNRLVLDFFCHPPDDQISKLWSSGWNSGHLGWPDDRLFRTLHRRPANVCNLITKRVTWKITKLYLKLKTLANQITIFLFVYWSATNP